MQPQKILLIGGTIVIAGIAIWWALHTGWLSVTPPSAAKGSTDAPPEFSTVAAVIDPTTIKLASGHIVRYIGVRTPSITKPVQCFGKEALLANESVVGKAVRLEAEPLLARSQDGAWTMYVWLIQGEVDPSPTPTPTEISPVSAVNTPTSDVANNPVLADLTAAAAQVKEALTTPTPEVGATNPAPTPPDPKDIFINERIMEGGFGFPVVAPEMKYGERILSAAQYGSATSKGLWGQCELEGEAPRIATKELTDCVIKGKVTVAGQKLYRTPACPAYIETIIIQSAGGQWFCAEDTAIDAGFSKAPDCP